MKIAICVIALLCNIISLKLHSNIKKWVSHNLPFYMRTNFSLRFFILLSLMIGVVATCGLTTLSWYWNIPIYLVGLFIISLISDIITDQNTKFHLFFIMGNKPWSVYIWTLTMLSSILAIYGYFL